MSALEPPVTYNQVHTPRNHTPGRRRISIYWAWSYPWEAGRDPADIENRFSTMTEVRQVAWPAYEKAEHGPAHFIQGIAGTLELFHRSTMPFQIVAGEATGHPVAVFQRIDQAGRRLPIDERVLADTDTLLIFGLDHVLSQQEAAPEEIDAIRQWLQREGTCLLLAPHHDVGATDDFEQRQVEFEHHGDPLVPRQQRFSQYTRSLMKALDVPVINKWGSHRPRHQRHSPPDRLPRSRHPPAARQRQHLQSAPPPAALRTHRPRQQLHPRTGTPARGHHPTPSVHRSGQHRIQRPAMDAANRQAGR